MDEKHCKTCRFGRLVGYFQVICGKRNRWESELYSCEWWKAKGKKEKKNVEQRKSDARK